MEMLGIGSTSLMVERLYNLQIPKSWSFKHRERSYTLQAHSWAFWALN